MQISAEMAANVIAAAHSLGYDSVPESWLKALSQHYRIKPKPDYFPRCNTATWVWFDPHNIPVACICHPT